MRIPRVIRRNPYTVVMLVVILTLGGLMVARVTTLGDRAADCRAAGGVWFQPYGWRTLCVDSRVVIQP